MNHPQAVCLLLKDGPKYLATTRRGTTNEWGLPGGKVDDGETPEQALVREIKEETGITLDIKWIGRAHTEDCGPGKDGKIFKCHAYIYHKPFRGEPKSMEDGILTGWVTYSDLINGPFGQYNKNLFQKLEIKSLRDVLPSAFRSEHMDSKCSKYLDVEVVEEMDSFEDGWWPGKEKFVHRWWKLANGKAVGWNENPSRGWSFPIAKY